MVLNSITGKLTEKSNFACCEVNGLEWHFMMSGHSIASLPDIGSEVRIFTLLKVNEHSISLYGFVAKEERSLFESLISVSGIGPKVALGMLSKASTENIIRFIIQKDDKALAKLPGLGVKTAQKLILQLSDTMFEQFGDLQSTGADGKPFAMGAMGVALAYRDLLSSLVAMGYEEKRCLEALEKLSLRWGATPPEEGAQLHQAILLLGTL
ncbi:MAG: Holliday junction branch migration protein RuvA [Spirochaetota bacterium]